MANTVTKSKNAVMLSAMDSNWLWNETGSFPGVTNGLAIRTIVFKAGITSNNTLILRDGSITGPIILSVTHAATAYDTYLLGGSLIRPVMLYSEQVFTSGALFSICFERR